MNSAKKYSIYVGGRLLGAGLGLVAIIGYSHFLSPGIYGEYAAYLALANLLNMSLFQWLRVSLTRHVAGTENDAPQFIGFSILVQGAVFTLLCVTALIVIKFGHYDSAFTVIAMLVSMALSDFTLEVLRAKHNAGAYVRQFLLRQILIILISAGTAKFTNVSNPIIAGCIIGNAAPSLLSFVKIVRESKFLLPSKDAQSYLRYGIPLILNYSVSGFLNSCDRLIVIAVLGKDLGGAYAFAADFARQLVMTLMESINLGAFPDAVHALQKNGYAAAKLVLENNFFMLISLAAPATLGLAITASTISELFFGQRFASTAAYLVPILAVGTFFRGLRVFYFDQAFQLNKKTELTAVSTALSAVLLVILTLTLTPTFGVVGAAWASLSAAALSLLCSRLVGGTALTMPVPIDTLGSVLIACGAVAATAFIALAYLPGLTGLAVAIGAGVTTYLITLAALQQDRMRRLWSNYKNGR